MDRVKGDLPDPDGDAQKLAIWAARRVAGSSGSGDVTGPGSAVDGDIAVFDGVTGKKIKDSGVAIDDLVQGPASATDGDFAQYDGATGELIKDGGYGPGSFASEAVHRRYVANGETRLVVSRTSQYVSPDFEIEDGGTLELEADGFLEIG